MAYTSAVFAHAEVSDFFREVQMIFVCSKKLFAGGEECEESIHP